MTAEASTLLAPPRFGAGGLRRRPRLLLGVLLALVLTGLLAAALAVRSGGAEDTYRADSRDVTGVADTQVRLLLELASGIEPDDAVARLVAGATGDWLTQVSGGRFTRAVRAGAIAPGAAVSVDATAVIGVQDDAAQVLVAASSGRRAFLFRVGLEQADGRWRVAAMQAAR